MDTKENNLNSVAPGVMQPDSAIHPDPVLNGPTTPEARQADTAPKDPRRRTSSTPFQDSLRRLLRDKRSVVSMGVLLFFVVLAIVGPPIYQHIGGVIPSSSGANVGPTVYHNPFQHDLDYEDLNPNGTFLLGTDAVGHDLFARLMQSLLISIFVALAVEVVDVVLGITIGVLAGYYGGWIDFVLARFTDIMFAFPGLLFIILLTGIFGPWADTNLSVIPILGANGNARLLLVSVALAFTAWPAMARYVRGQTLQIKENQFIEAARTSGSSDFTIILKHIVPNLFSIVIVASTLNIANTIVGEAGISLLGLGVKQPGASLGLMISDSLQSISTPHAWEVLLPCIVLAIIVLCFSFLGDGVRDAFDPRSKD
jgi:ABC-type dipeptide/oligopeptide/nickel transport system permease subunit